jgi:predicted dehydrogenase
VEIFCERALIVVEDDWFGPVSWTRDDESGVLQGEELVAAAGFEDEGPFGPNPDAEFLRAVAAGTPASPDVAAALRAHQLADAVYRSAGLEGAPIDVTPA